MYSRTPFFKHLYENIFYFKALVHTTVLKNWDKFGKVQRIYITMLRVCWYVNDYHKTTLLSAFVVILRAIWTLHHDMTAVARLKFGQPTESTRDWPSLSGAVLPSLSGECSTFGAQIRGGFEKCRPTVLNTS